jgi:hypothetical protein
MHNSIEPTDCIQRLRTLPAETLPPYNWQEFQRRARRRTAPARVATDWRPLAVAAALLLFVGAIAVWGRLGGGGRHVVVASGAVEDGAAAWGRGSDSTPGADGWSLPQTDSAFAELTPQGQANGLASAHGSQAQANGAASVHGSQGQANGSASVRGWQAQVNGSATDRLWRTPANGVAALSNDRDLAQGEAVGPNAATVAGQTSGESAVANRRSRAIESWLAALPREPAVVRVGTRAAVAGLEDRIAQVDDLMTSMRIEGTSGDRLADLQRERLRLVGSLAQVRYAEVVASASP